MLQKKPITEWTSQDLRRWRARLSKLILLTDKAQNKEEAWRIIREYRDGEITYKEAKERLEKLAEHPGH